jgi:peptidoglycan/xylan/chitin deacetylase (PgdA/CDA1 family)
VRSRAVTARASFSPRTSCWRKKPGSSRRSSAFLQQSFSLVSIDEYLDALHAGKCRNLVTLTFDDGLRNQLTVAHEVLSRLRVPATFYVCPALVGTPFSTWTWELEPRLARLSSLRRQEIFARGSADSFAAFLHGLKTRPLRRREALWDEIVKATPEFAFTPDEERQFGLMDWAERARLDQSLITIGTHTHVDLPQYDARHFAYPNGSHDQRASRAVARHFDSGVTMEHRAVGRASAPHLLPRVHIQWDPSELAWTLARVARD